MDIKELREKVDSINEKMVSLFAERMELSEQIAQYKKQNKLPIRDAERERQLLNKVSDLAGEDMSAYTRVLFTTMMDLSRSYQSKHMQTKSELGLKISNALSQTPNLFPERAHVACQGIEGAYSQKACDKMFTLPDIMYVNTFENVFQAVDTGLCDYGIVPLENSTAGSVNMTYDLLAKYDFYIVRSIKMQINHVLLTKSGVRLDQVKEIYSHEQAINQCSSFLRSLKGVKITVVANTAIAANMVATSDRTDVAAISSHDCAEQYGLVIQEGKVQNTDSNFTKFICISKKLEIYPGANRTSLVFSTANKPGALYNVMARLSSLGINVIKLESRPIVGRDFEFMFYFDLDASVYSKEFSQLIFELETQVEGFKYYGSYSEVN
ncbi:MAG: bifunctional chorismate mutase/prephenate dehydratase [Clostridiales bacterium]|nr:bifunctional chorismate mutase/prephenate dehydratase [Clostridiales bacterium]